MMRALATRRLSIVGFTLAGLLLVFVGATAYWGLDELHEATNWVERSLTIQSNLAIVLSLLTDAEAGQRGFLLTGSPSYLEPHDTAMAQLPQRLARLRQLTTDNPGQQERLATLETLADRKLAELNSTIAARKRDGAEAVARLVLAGEGKRVMDEIRGVVEAMRNEERRLLKERTVLQAEHGRVATQRTVGSLLLAMVLVVIAGGLLYRAGRERDREFAARATAEKIAAAIATSEERLRVTLHSIGDAVIATDDYGRVTLLNRVAQALTGWSEAEALGRGLDEVFVIVNETTRQPAANPVERVLREGVISGLANHTVLLARDGRKIPIDDSAAPIRCADGRVVGAVIVFRDISQRRRDEKKFRRAIEAAPNANVMVNGEGRIVLINASTERLFGYARAELIGQPVEVLVPQRYRSAHAQDRTAFHRAPEMRAMGVGRELYGVRKDGREVPIEIGLSPLEVEGETLVLASIIDITERRRAEKDHVRFARMLDSGFDAIIVRDTQDRITSWNRGAIELYGWTREEALGQVTHSLFKTVFPRPLDEILAEMSQNDRWEGELIHTGKDGAVITVFSRWTLERDAQGRGMATLETNMDISERKRAEQALRDAYRDARQRQSEAEGLATVARALSTLDLDAVLQTITESACLLLDAEVATLFRLEPDSGHLVLAAGGGPRGATVNRNISVPRGAGLVWLAVDKREAVISTDLLRDPRFVYPPATRARIETARHRAGLAMPLVVQGRVTGALFVGVLPGRVFGAGELRLATAFADQAAVAIANAELYDEAQRANRAKDEFLAMLSHELRTPLTTILGWARTLRTFQTPPDKAAHALAAIERNALLQARLIEDLLDVSRIVSGKLSLETEPVHMAAIVEAALETVRGPAEASGIRITHDVDRTLPALVGDAARLQQVVWNLLSNAVKFTERGGRVDINVRQVNGMVELAVQDTGRGIRPELLPHVFDRFRQGEPSESRATGGLGLGLTIVRHLIERHGGTVQAASPGEGQGATFTVWLPLAHGTGEEHEKPLATTGKESQATSATLKDVEILVVEDDPDTRGFLGTVLSSAGAQVRLARSVKEARDMLKKHPVDVMISDLSMAGEDGYALIRHVRGTGTTAKRLVTIALTARAREEDRSAALAAGFDIYVRKPVDPGDLVGLIARSARPEPRAATPDR